MTETVFFVFVTVRESEKKRREEEEEEEKEEWEGGCCRVKLRLNSYTGKQLLHIANPWNNVKIVCLDRFEQEWRSPNL